MLRLAEGKAKEWVRIKPKNPKPNPSKGKKGDKAKVQTLVKIDEDTMLSGSSDDLIRVMNVHPNKIVGVLGEHEGDFPVKCVAMSRQRDFVASISHDATIKFWDLTCDEVYFDHVASAQHTE